MNPKDIDALALVLAYMETGRIGHAHKLLEELYQKRLDEAIHNPPKDQWKYFLKPERMAQ